MRHERVVHAVQHSVQHTALLHAARRMGRHAALALIGAVAFGLVALALAGRGIDAQQQLATAGDPVKISDRALGLAFNQDVAQREIQAALATGDADLAQSFLDLAHDRGVAVDPALAGKVKAATADAASLTSTAGRFVHGLWTGEPDDAVSFVGTAVGDLFVFGDIRDATREGARLVSGQPADPLILGLACVGLAITAGTYASLGAGAPGRIGLTLIKAASRTGRLSSRLAAWAGRSLRGIVDWGALSRATTLGNPVVAVRAAREAVKVEKAGDLVDLVGNVGRIETKAGTQAALDSLKIAEGPRDMSRLARLAEASGNKTRAIVKLLGRAAIILTVGAFELASWMFWAAFMLLGFVCSCKTAVERLTLRHIHRRKVREFRKAQAQYLKAQYLGVPLRV